MTESTPLPGDHAQRQAALDPQRSFIVQAPAGSGKTGLLTQRFLRLLAMAEQPEEIVAITFTRKAAAEMRGRILQALAAARSAEPAEPWLRQTWKLAGAALQRADALGWNLLENPQRLRVRTIDSLCQYLARQMPLGSGFGEPPRVEEDARLLYRAAARSTLGELESDSELGASLALLLRELDNNLDALHGLLADMLERRDQWLPILLRPNPRAAIEHALEAVVSAQLEAVRRAIAANHGAELVRLARYAADEPDRCQALTVCRDLDELPPATPSGLPAWIALADMVLTRQGEWRRSVDRRGGFPPGAGEAGLAKQDMVDLLDTLRPDEGLAAMLHGLRLLPAAVYPDQEWAMIEALFTVLRGAAAHLRVVFREQGRVDFSETALAAQQALGGELEPTDLALRLDYRLKHLLVDEFQDTSQSQHELLKGLTAGWQRGDGRTLFLVGDPMQSIYRFRKAEVGLFLDSWEGELGQVSLEPLQLTVNFRSEQGVVDWVNEQFPRVFPPRPDKMKGAVPYASCEAFKPAGAGPAVTVHPFVDRDDAAEAARIVELIHRARAQQPDGTIAVLVRSKAHLDCLIQSLREAGLSYQAVEIGALAQRAAVLDLMALTLAMLHRADRVSWLALLHGPLCGLTRSDLHALASVEAGDSGLVADLLADESRLAALSRDGRARAANCAGIMQAALEERGRKPLRDWVEGTWLALGGPACLPDESAVEDVEVFFQLLQELDGVEEPLNPERLRESMDALFSLPDPRGDPRLQLMTIHKAKGLEFDTVILPGLGKSTRGEGRKLLYWQEVVGEDGNTELLFGPVKSARRSEEPRTSAWIKRLQSEMSRLETGRLLYVAATRAKRCLHLLGHASAKRDGALTVDSGSLLSQLWPALEPLWNEVAEASAAALVEGREAGTPQADGESQDVPAARRWRLPSGWVCPSAPATVGSGRDADPEAVDGLVYDWAGDTARAVGTVVHAWLQRLVQVPATRFAELPSFAVTTQRMLAREGVPAPELEPALRRVRAALECAMEDERGRWILSDRHDDSRCEVPLTALIDGQLRHLVIDRTFVDENGVRWIIDYKTGVHLGGDPDGFLDEEEERYRAQLQSYAKAFHQLEQRPIRTALYFPLIRGGWREVEV